MSELYALSHGQHFDDDDDGEFSDDAENGIKNGLSRSGPVAVLEGCMSLIDGRVFYSGEWYMKPQVSTAAALVKSKFKYKLKRGFDFKDPSDEVSMDGCFFVKTQSAEGGKIKIKERDAVLNFGSFEQKKSYLVNGKGENEYGKFLLVGKYFIKNVSSLSFDCFQSPYSKLAVMSHRQFPP
uniref:Uncharacterized protein n=1 Tax=Corethron hystrix TaxID=216773 RepID=A0A7S1B4B5_9STRA|mmetsp:Transcript_12460/g.27424  ORF Transcript_12460/g.27424 Transcript_12460/m.27424 type:complete len:181 (+) Transcript_12460:56-598(+)